MMAACVMALTLAMGRMDIGMGATVHLAVADGGSMAPWILVRNIQAAKSTVLLRLCFPYSVSMVFHKSNSIL